jgi:hypothetical protein
MAGSFSACICRRPRSLSASQSSWFARGNVPLLVVGHDLFERVALPAGRRFTPRGVIERENRLPARGTCPCGIPFVSGSLSP